MTKSFTAATVLALRDAGELRLDDEAPLLAGVRRDGGPPPVTYRHLLSMDSGLRGRPVGRPHMDMDGGRARRPLAGGLCFAHPDGHRVRVLQPRLRAARRPSADTTARLLEPLGLNRTRGPSRPRRLGAPAPTAPIGHGAFAGMGGLWSCLEDIATWVAWLDDAFPARDDPTAPLGGRRAARCSRSTAGGDRTAATGSGSARSTTSASGPSSATPVACPGTARTCAGCPGGGSV